MTSSSSSSFFVFLLLLLLTLCAIAVAIVQAQVSHDHIAIRIKGNRRIILSGSIHYARSTPDMWPDLFRKSQLAGLNTIETYVFWNLHEPEREQYNFEGNLDLIKFITFARDVGLNVILRIGPYACAEINYGGFPSWLKEIPEIQFRTFNEPFMNETKRWISYLVDKIRPLLASQEGGNIILMQIENEYDNVIKYHGTDGIKYIQWISAMADSLYTGIPWIMCVGSSGTTLNTVNGMYGHELLDDHWIKFPGQPGIWTENWPGWYNNFGYGVNRRSAVDVAYAVARFFAMGGTAMNYYMWHGGTNFGRTAGWLTTTSYDYDAPLDEFGYPMTGGIGRKYEHLSKLNRLLMDYEHILLNSDQRPKQQKLGHQQYAYIMGDMNTILLFLCNDDPEQLIYSNFLGKEYALPPKSVSILKTVMGGASSELLFDTATIDPSIPETKKFYRPLTMDEQLVNYEWSWWSEPFPLMNSKMTHHQFKRRVPEEQLQFTRDKTDYTFYTTMVDLDDQQDDHHLISSMFSSNSSSPYHWLHKSTSSSSSSTSSHLVYSEYRKEEEEEDGKRSTRTLVLKAMADIAHVYIDGVYVNSSKSILQESRGKFSGMGYEHEIIIPIPERRTRRTSGFSADNKRQLTILTCALGLTKIENQIDGDNLAQEKKGIWSSVLIQPGNKNITSGTWMIQPGLHGELMQVYKNVDRVEWNRYNIAEGINKGLTWWRLSFKYIALHNDQQPPLVVDFTGMNKGIAYLNGHCIGRYWMVKAELDNSFVPLRSEGLGEPSQKYYHLPREWLKDGMNDLVFFEELGGTPEHVTINQVYYFAHD